MTAVKSSHACVMTGLAVFNVRGASVPDGMALDAIITGTASGIVYFLQGLSVVSFLYRNALLGFLYMK
jgi:hypothetical protein